MAYNEELVIRRAGHSRLQRMIEAVRSFTLGPFSLKDPALVRYFGSGGSTSGVSVNETTALRLAAVWNAVTMIADDVASLPLSLYKTDGTTRQKFVSHPVNKLVKYEPNPEMTTMICRRTIQAHALLWSNGYAEIERNRAGQPIALWPLVPESVRPMRTPTGTLFYRVTTPSGTYVDLPAGDVLHLMGPSHTGTVGDSFIEQARNSIGLALAAEDFGAAFYKNGGTVSGVVSNKGAKPQAAAKDNKEAALEARHQGIQRAHKWLQLWNDATFTPISVAQNNAQFLETRVFQIREVARWFKMPPHKLGDLADATYSNVEQMDAAYYASCLRPWIIQWEQELARKLIAPSEQNIQYFRHSLEGFLRADAAGRATFYKELFSIGAITINEIRALEELDPVNGGDTPFVPINNVLPLDRVDEYVDSLIAKRAEPTALPPVKEPVPPTEEQLNAFIAAMEQRLAEHTDLVAHHGDLVTNAIEAKAQAQGDLVTVATERDQLAAAMKERDDVTTVIGSLEQRMVDTVTGLKTDADAALALATAHVEDLRQQRDTAQTTIGMLEADIETLTTRLADAVASERDDKAQAVAALEQTLAEVRAEIETERTIRATAEAALAEAVTAHETAGARVEALQREIDEAQTKRAEAEQRAAALATDRDGLLTKVSVHEAVIVELRHELADVPALRQMIEDERVKRAAVEATLTATTDELRTVGEGISSQHQRVQTLEQRFSEIETAHRTLIVDAVERLLQRESDRARKAQTTPEKLRAWVESFYQTYGDVCRAVYRPVILAWAACAGVPADRALSEIVQAHVDQSRRELRLVLDHDDPDDQAAALARLLRRWETERAHAVADRLLAEGERYGH